VQQKADAIDVLKQPAALGRNRVSRERVHIDVFRLSFPIQLRQFGDLAAVELWRSETQLFFERLLQNLYVLVLTKNQRNNEPVISCANLAVGPAISHKRLAIPRRHIGWHPVEFARLLVKGRSLVVEVTGRQKFSGRNWLNGPGEL
jgi:hypothetical protein